MTNVLTHLRRCNILRVMTQDNNARRAYTTENMVKLPLFIALLDSSIALLDSSTRALLSLKDLKPRSGVEQRRQKPALFYLERTP